MHQRCLNLLAALGVLFLLGGPVAAQTPTAAEGQATTAAKKASPLLRTADGRPDLRGSWNYDDSTPLERPDQLAGKETLSPEETAQFETERDARRGFNSGSGGTGYDTRIWFERPKMSGRTSLIVDPPDGKMPPRTAEGQKRAMARAEARRRGRAADGPEDRTVGERCLVGDNSGPPMKPIAYNHNVIIFQTRDYVALLNESIHRARVIPLDGRPRTAFRQWIGQSRGRWEGDTLVVETTNYVGAAADYSAFGASENLRVIERFTGVDADTLRYEFTIDDPAIWTRPWTVRLTMTPGPSMYEYACHEGNHSLENILSTARNLERQARDGASE